MPDRERASLVSWAKSLVPDADRYTFKPSPYSSHTLLLNALPAQGAGRRVLDLGCGPGHLAAALAARGYDVTGIDRPGAAGDVFPRMVRRIDADLDHGLPPLETRYDYVLCADILEHLKEPARMLARVAAVLAPGGVVVASLPNSGNLWFRANILFGRFPQDERGLFDRTHLHFYMWDGWRDLFASAGFRFEDVRPTGIPVGLAMEGLAGSTPVRLAETVSYLLARGWKTLFAYQFVVTARAVSR